jgi:pimeloyl-ACP methyl ester carboxylesterase
MTTTAYVLEHKGTPLHYWLTGPQTSPLIVCTHGATVDHRMFAAQIAVLATQHRVLSWDVRGHGLSRPTGEGFTIRQAVEDLLAILEQIGAARATFLGQSMGGNISQEIAFHYPQRVQALIVIDSAWNTRKLSALERWSVGLTPAMLAVYPYELLKRQAAKASALKPEVQDYVYEASCRLTKAEYGKVLTETTLCLHYEPDYHVAASLLLLRGDHDNLGSIKASMTAWVKHDPHSRYFVVPNAGHCSNQDNPDFVNQQLLDFLRQ